MKNIIRFDPNKNSKPVFYAKGIINFLTPSLFYRSKLEKLLSNNYLNKSILDRVNYYNKCTYFDVSAEAKTIKEFKRDKKKVYYFDLLKYLKYFDQNLRISYKFGDVNYIPDKPTIVKSRPIYGDNKNSVIMKLNTVRHFIFVDDKLKYEDKMDKAVWRGKCYRPNRVEFVKTFYDKDFCDIGQTNTKGERDVAWQKPKMSLKNQLKYKFIVAIEGNDVASNLKWAMSSNSLVLMAKPKFETWFMEGRLKPNYHYALLKDDYSDMEEKIEYYSENINEAKEIIKNAHNHVQMFTNRTVEDIISILVLKKYFETSNQL